ncbi:MAG TPA: ATP-binding protein [Chloroflexota bacterium]|nr:ATP-binding protein [Chloroflexota bacterium]
MDNPFRYGEVATGAHFTNRVAELAELAADLRSGQNVVIISPRRYGKTSLVIRAMERLKQERVLTAYLDLFRTPTKDRFADRLAGAIYNGLVAPVERARQRALELFQQLSIRPKITLNPDGTPSFEFTAGHRAHDLDRTIEDLLEMPGQIARQRQRRVVLVLDEFQEVTSIDPHLPALMRAVFQHQGDVAHVFLGSKRHLLHHVFTDENEPLYKLAKPVTLRPINLDDFGEFIRERFAATEQHISEDALDRILAITGGHPHDTQELCYFTWAEAYIQRTEATPSLVERALSQVLEAEDAHYTTLWEGLSVHQRLVLTALVADENEVFSEAYRRRHRLGAASTVQRSLERLVERELVEFAAQGAYRVTDAFLRAWIAKLVGLDEGKRGVAVDR